MASTRKLVDDLDEQALLEELIEGVKPAMPQGPEHRRLHWLLATPFRYPPLRYGSRFGARHERGIWYGSIEVPTALAEVAYYRLLFLDGSEAELALHVELTVFSARFDSALGADLTCDPFTRYAARISSPTDYKVSQSLGSAMREDGVELFLFRSARARGEGTNVGMFSPRALASKKPVRQETWVCHATRAGVDFIRGDLTAPRGTLDFPRGHFEVDGRLPSPAT